MFEKRLNKKDLEELRKRSEIVNQYRLTIEALELQTQIYIQKLLPKYGIDMNKNYEIDFESGKISVIKEKPIKTEK